MDLDNMQKPRFEEALKIAVNKHDLAAIQIYDPQETSLPDVGLVRMADAETGTWTMDRYIRKKVRKNYARWYTTARTISNRPE